MHYKLLIFVVFYVWRILKLLTYPLLLTAVLAVFKVGYYEICTGWQLGQSKRKQFFAQSCEKMDF